MLLLLAALVATAAAESSELAGTYTIVVDRHISELMPVYLDSDLNSEWAPSLLEQRELRSAAHGALLYQRHAMPWPLAQRETLLACSTATDHRRAIFTSECRSVEDPSVPPRAGAVRFELSRTVWRFEALPGSRTRLHLHMAVPVRAVAGMPKYVVRHVQQTSLRDAVRCLVDAVERLRLPPAAAFARWQRSRAEAAAAALDTRMAPSLIASITSASVLQCGHVQLSAVALTHCLAFGLLALWWRRKGKHAGQEHTPKSQPWLSRRTSPMTQQHTDVHLISAATVRGG